MATKYFFSFKKQSEYIYFKSSSTNILLRSYTVRKRVVIFCEYKYIVIKLFNLNASLEGINGKIWYRILAHVWTGAGKITYFCLIQGNRFTTSPIFSEILPAGHRSIPPERNENKTTSKSVTNLCISCFVQTSVFIHGDCTTSIMIYNPPTDSLQPRAMIFTLNCQYDHIQVSTLPHSIPNMPKNVNTMLLSVNQQC